jgi:hypothetical protein
VIWCAREDAVRYRRSHRPGSGTLRPVVGKELPLAEAARAHKEILEPESVGKIVLIC